MHRQQTFAILSARVGKGNKKSLQRMQIENEQREIVREVQDRASMETEIINQNKRM